MSSRPLSWAIDVGMSSPSSAASAVVGAAWPVMRETSSSKQLLARFHEAVEVVGV